jgi:hypothetical protein
MFLPQDLDNTIASVALDNFALVITLLCKLQL